MTLFWNRLIYACWAPVYDRFIGIPPFVHARRLAIERLQLRPGDRLLIVGIGTGADLCMISDEIGIVGVDLSPSMLHRAHRKTGQTSAEVHLIVADAARLPLKAAKFNRVLLALILSVVPDPRACLAEVTRVSSPDCKIIIFDKFLQVEKPGLLRRMTNVVTRIFGTDINRNLEKIVDSTPLVIASRQPAAFGGAYEVVELRHESCSDVDGRNGTHAEFRVE